MSCYLRHLKPVLEKVGCGTLTRDQRKVVDNTVRSITGARGNVLIWPVVKEWLEDSVNQERLIKEIKNKLVDPCQ
ncbi:hypothetical protein P378_17260 [Desulforamulus profundi]|uniref:Uncharacterized protein n=1 Tax=Desulforamulus profundi TaxID=1383067 RepID=A0A2C6MCJ1_9FIRM|nr:hypothetical protein [Desulforamulus profundi]PHJ37264.1 hypothetical protein P378_17260 [Desulforamulus profundi]